MGYSSYVTGDGLTFSRALTASEVRAFLRILKASEWASYFLNLDVQEETVETDEGTLTKMSAQSLSATGTSGTAYGLTEDLTALIKSLPADVTVSGYVERIGEEFPDAERIHVIGRRVVAVKAEIVWPDPS
jgi:hypothetical protein